MELPCRSNILFRVAVGLLLIPLLQQPTYAQAETASEAVKRGYLELGQGRPAQAIATLRKAYKLYRNLDDQPGMKQALVAQSKAYSSLGQNFNACSTSLEALDIEATFVCQVDSSRSQARAEFADELETLSPRPLTVEMLNALGSSLQKMGELDASRLAFQRAEKIGTTIDINDAERQASQLGLANNHRLLLQRLQSQFVVNTDEAVEDKLVARSIEETQQAFALYEDLGRSQDTQVSVRARLSWLQLYQVTQQWSEAENWEPVDLRKILEAKRPQIKPMLSALQQTNYDDLADIDAIYARLNFVGHLLKDHQSGESLRPAFDVAVQALNDATRLNNIRAQSFALGTLGQLYQQTNQTSQAQAALGRAASLAQSIQAWDSAYQWQRYQGQIETQAGNRDKAIAHYQASLKSLESVRENLLAVDSELQFSFLTEVAPVYQELVQLLLDSEPGDQLALATEVYQQLKTAELENFLRCGRIETTDISDIVEAPPTVYVLRVDGRYEVILRTPAGTYIRHQPDSRVIQDNLRNMAYYLEVPTLDNLDEVEVILPHMQALYNQLIQPIENHLPKDGTLNFVLDNSLQGLPMAMLHDGQHYLVESYSLSLSVNGQLQPPKQLAPGPVKTIIAGLSELSPSISNEKKKGLKSLPEVKAEAGDIAALSIAPLQLLNQRFNRNRLQEALLKDYPILHIASHGQFSSDPEQTYFLSWDDKITANDLHQMLMERTNLTKYSLELLVLSACQTAKGDKRSTLGIAGIASQAGVRSTVASLWLVGSKSTSILMAEFYQNLDKGIPKAEALRQAQLTLMQSDYSHPFFWAPFVLAGSWL